MRKLFLIIFTLISFNSFGQIVGVDVSHKMEPRWLSKPPRSSNPDMQYYVVPVHTTDLAAASAMSLSRLVEFLPRDWEVTNDDTVGSTSKYNRTNDGLTRDRQDVLSFNINAKGAPAKLNCKRVASYWNIGERGMYHSYYLYQVSAPGKNGPYDITETTTKYGIHGLWRSLIIPGWGQMHKGSYTKGGIILGGTAVLAGGIVATETIRSNYAKKINMTHNVAEKKLFVQRTNQFATARNICIGAAGALYVYNLIDAIVAPGAERVIIKKKGGDMYMDYSPTSISLSF